MVEDTEVAASGRLASILSERLADEARLAELVRAERARAAELNALIGAIGEGIVVVDPAGNVTLANRTAQQMLASQEPATLSAYLARLGITAGPEVRELARHGPIQARLGDSDGRWVEVAAYAVEPSQDAQAPRDVADAAEAGGETILILRDVTAARVREQARDAFIDVLSHELRTPVTTIYAGTEVLARRETTLDEAARVGIFRDIHAEAERLHWLVEDVVALTRFEDGAIEIGNEPVLLQRVLPAIAQSERRKWPGGTFDLQLPLDLPPVAGEATYVEQVARNMLANAMKYGGSDQKAIVEARTSRSGAEVEVRVLDNGPGLAEVEPDHLFELYYRSPDVVRRISGSGIGLFVCARLIEAMGGHIWAANRAEGGAEFGFALRVMTADPAPDPEKR